MKHSTAYNHCKRFEARIANIYSTARFYHPTCDELCQQTKEVFQDPTLAKCPAWVRQSISDLSSHLFNDIQTRHVVWMFKTERGIMAYDLLTPAERDVVNHQNRPGNHYWVKETTCAVGTVGNPGNYRVGESFTRTFVVTDKKW